MILAETLQCASSVQPPNYVELIPSWAAKITCDLPLSTNGWEFGWTAVAALATGATAVVALFVAKGSDKKALKRDRESRALASHERWVENFLQLGQPLGELRDTTESVRESSMLTTGTYSIHLMTESRKLGTALQLHAKSIRLIHNAASAAQESLHLDPKELESISGKAFEQVTSEDWNASFRSYIYECAEVLARFHASSMEASAAVSKLNSQEAAFRNEFANVFAWIETHDEETEPSGRQEVETPVSK